MRQWYRIFNVAFVIALGVSFVQCGKSSQSAGGEADSADENGHSSVVYINTDSLLLKYDYAKVLNDVIMQKEESSRTDFNQKYRVFQQDAMEFQRKVQNNGFLSLDRAQSEEQRLAKAERDLQELNNRLSSELMREQERINRELRDTLQLFLKSYSAKHNYKMVLSNTMGDNVLYSDPKVDITNAVVEQLNKRYQVATKK
ncbi:MAG: OmpH family outer membrane protein [Breznakibacter sp.]